jgi:biopolymer transport protein ExbD
MASVFHHPIFGGASEPFQMPRSPVPLSMIDVVFLLLTFLLLRQFPLAEGLLSMPLAGQTAAPIKPPAHTLWVQVTSRDGQIGYRLNDWPASHTVDELTDNIRGFVKSAGADDVAVVVSAEPGVPFGRLVEVWDRCRAVGVKKLALPAEPDRPASPTSQAGER